MNKNMEIGENAVVIGNVPPNIHVGEGSVVIGPTHQNGSVNITQPMAIGNGAEADKTSIAIGAFSKAGITNSSSKINPVQNSTTNPSAQEPTSGDKKHNSVDLLKSPIGYVWFTAIGTVIAAIMVYLINKHLRLSL